MRDALLQFVPVLVQQYGDLAASVSAEWYDEMRAKAGVTGRFRALPSPSAMLVQAQETVRWGVSPLWADNPGQALALLSGAVDRFALQPGRDTIADTARREGVRWARVPMGSETCAFCLMLASRGFAYSSEHTAGGLNGSSYHDECRCQPTPDWSSKPELEGYEPDAMYGKYLAARGDDYFDTKGILSRLRQQQGIN